LSATALAVAATDKAAATNPFRNEIFERN